MNRLTRQQVVLRGLPVSIRGVFLALVIIGCLLPLFWTLLTSLQIWPEDSFSPPHWVFEPSLEQYLEVGVAEPNFISELLTSVTLALCTAALATGTAFLAAYSISRSRFRGRNLLVQSFLILATLPIVAYLIPLSNILDILHLSNTFIGVTLAETALYIPLAVYVLVGYLNGLPLELEEAAHLDGATLPTLLWRIVVPTSM